jgi:hypothetical protein
MEHTPRPKTSAARWFAGHIGTPATAARSRARTVADTWKLPRERLVNVFTGAENIRKGIAHMLGGPLWAYVLPSRSTRVGWHIGRFVGRIEGALGVVVFGVRLWWRRRNMREDQTPSA